MAGGAPLDSKSITFGDNPFADGSRGLRGLPPSRSRAIRARYEAWQAHLATERRSWPEPLTASLYDSAILDEVDATLAARGVAP